MNELLDDPFTRGGAAKQRIFSRPARRDEGPQVVDTLTDAFAECALFDWLVNGGGGADERRRMIFEAFVNDLGFGRGEVWTTADHGGAAIWYQPGQWRLGLSEMSRFLPLFLKVAGYGTTVQKFIGLSRLERHHPRGPHFYLLSIGVAPRFRKRGYAGSLMRPMLKRCDERKFPAYLETPDEDNIALYEHYGFELQGQLELPFGGPAIWTMLRVPAVFGSDS